LNGDTLAGWLDPSLLRHKIVIEDGGHCGATQAHYQRDRAIDGRTVSPKLASPTCHTPCTHLTPNSVPGISAVPHDDNLRYFDVKVHGPTQSPYEGQFHHNI